MMNAADLLAIRTYVESALIFDVRCYATEMECTEVSTEQLTDDEVRAEVTMFLAVGVEEGACTLAHALRALEPDDDGEVDAGPYIPTHDRAFEGE